MEIKTNGKRNIILPDVSNKKKIVLKDINGDIVSYIKTGKNGGRITGIVPDVVFAELEDVPLRPVNMGVLNIAKTLDLTDEMNLVMEKQNAIRQAFSAVLDFKAEIEDKFIKNKKQTDIALSELAEVARNTGIINDERYEEIKAVDLSQSVDIEKIYGLCSDLALRAGIVESEIDSITTILNSHEHEKQTKESLGLGKVDNTRDIDKPVSKAVQEALDEKVSKEELTEFAEYIERLKKRQGEIEDGIQSLGGICANPIPIGGKVGDVLTKRSDLDGDFWWSKPASSENATEEKAGIAKIATQEDATNGVDNTKIMTPLKVATVLENESTKLKAQIDANADAILKTRNDLQEEIDENVGDITALQAETTTIRSDLDDLGDQVSGIEEKIPENASATNQLATKSDIEAIPKFKVVVVDSLPATGEEKTIYLVPKDGEAPDVHDEYLWTNNKFELIGNTEIDLSEYAKTEYVDAREQAVRADYAQADSELQTQINGQATAITEAQGDIVEIKNNYTTKEYVDTTEQEIIENFMEADTALQTQITGLSNALATEQDKITAIEGKIPTNASTSNLLSTASDLLNATQDVRADFAEADSELQTQITGQATVLAEIQDDVMANMTEIADLKTTKQDELTAGENITIENNVISASGGSADITDKITNCITEIPQDIKLELINWYCFEPVATAEYYYSKTPTIAVGSILWYYRDEPDGEAKVISIETNSNGTFYTLEVIKDHYNFSVGDIRSNVRRLVDEDVAYLVLKSGSKVYVPNGKNTDGSNKFDEVVIESDKTASYGHNTLDIVWYHGNGIDLLPLNLVYSGSTAPSDNQYMLWYDTTNNQIKYTNNSGASWSAEQSLPLGVIATSSSAPTSIDQVFNGFGYIGSTVFALPGVKGLAPNGRNEDGTLKNIEILLDKVITRTMTGVSKYSEFAITKSAIGINDHVLKESENYLYNAQGSIVSDRFVGGNITFSTVSPYNVTSFQPKTTFHAVDYFDAVKSSDFATEIATTTSTASFKNPAVVIENYRSGNNWYRVWSDGWIEQGGTGTAETYTAKGTITFNRPFTQTGYTCTVSPNRGGSDEPNGYFVTYNGSLTRFSWKLRADSNYFASTIVWYACGY